MTQHLTKTALAGLFTAAVAASSANADMVQTDLRYGDKERNQFDLYLPDGVDNPPVVVFVHGGRWYRNDRDQVLRYDRPARLNAAGIAVAAINYTHSSEAIWPAQRDDLSAALTYLTANADELGFDASRMAVWGQSSGAHMALWAGILDAESDAFDLDSVVSWYAPSNLAELRGDRVADAVPGENERFPEPSPESLLLGKPVPENPGLADALSPERVLAEMPAGADLPAFLVAHGDADFVVSPMQSERLHDTLMARGDGTDSTLQLIAGGKHGGDPFGPAVDDVIEFVKLKFD